MEETKLCIHGTESVQKIYLKLIPSGILGMSGIDLAVVDQSGEPLPNGRICLINTEGLRLYADFDGERYGLPLSVHSYFDGKGHGSTVNQCIRQPGFVTWNGYET